MYDILTSPSPLTFSSTFRGITPTTCTFDPQDPWLFTDPAAKTWYSQHNRLAELQQDILTYVMYDGRWTEDEVALMGELQHLVGVGVLYLKDTFGYLSPHPTVYRVAQEEVIRVNGGRIHVHPSDDVTFQPWLARVSKPGCCAPLHIGRLQSVTVPQLCGKAFPNICALCSRDIAMLHHTLPKGPGLTPRG